MLAAAGMFLSACTSSNSDDPQKAEATASVETASHCQPFPPSGVIKADPDNTLGPPEDVATLVKVKAAVLEQASEDTQGYYGATGMDWS